MITVYILITAYKITNIFAAEPKTVVRYVMYSEAVNGSYEIDLAYLE